MARRPTAGLDAPGRTRRSTIVAWITAVLLAALTAALDFLIHDISISLIIVLAVAMLVGTLWRERAWRWALVTGLAIPLSHLIYDTILHHGSLARSLVLIASFIPSFVGAYMGAFLNKMVSELLGKEAS